MAACAPLDRDHDRCGHRQHCNASKSDGCIKPAKRPLSNRSDLEETVEPRPAGSGYQRPQRVLERPPWPNHSKANGGPHKWLIGKLAQYRAVQSSQVSLRPAAPRLPDNIAEEAESQDVVAAWKAWRALEIESRVIG